MGTRQAVQPSPPGTCGGGPPCGRSAPLGVPPGATTGSFGIIVADVLLQVVFRSIDQAAARAHVRRRRGVFATPARKAFYNIRITFLSVAVVLIIGTIELIGVLVDQTGFQSGRWSGSPPSPSGKTSDRSSGSLSLASVRCTTPGVIPTLDHELIMHNCRRPALSNGR